MQLLAVNLFMKNYLKLLCNHKLAKQSVPLHTCCNCDTFPTELKSGKTATNGKAKPLFTDILESVLTTQAWTSWYIENAQENRTLCYWSSWINGSPRVCSRVSGANASLLGKMYCRNPKGPWVIVSYDQIRPRARWNNIIFSCSKTISRNVWK